MPCIIPQKGYEYLINCNDFAVLYVVYSVGYGGFSRAFRMCLSVWESWSKSGKSESIQRNQHSLSGGLSGKLPALTNRGRARSRRGDFMSDGRSLPWHYDADDILI